MCSEADIVFCVLSVLSIIQCTFQYSHYDTGVVEFYKPSGKKFIESLTSSKKDIVTEDKYVGYMFKVYEHCFHSSQK
jgi:hypothetical protein